MSTSMTNSLKPYPLGAHIESSAVRFSFVSKREDCGVLLFDRQTGRKIAKVPFTADDRIGNVYCKYIEGVDANRISYQFYEGNEIVPDRYARGFAGQFKFGKERKNQDWRAVVTTNSFDWQGDKRPRLAYEDCVIYCAHVRGFTQHVSSKVVNRGTFAGMAEKLTYLKETGITTVELQPAYEFAEIPTGAERKAMLSAQSPALMAGQNEDNDVIQKELDLLCPKKCNYWGYKHGYYYAPKAAYAMSEDACTEFKEMIRAFHKEGMEVVMQFYFPKTVKNLEITEILKFWVLEYHVDGFHLMGENLPIDLIASDEMLADTKLWYYYFDTDKIYDRGEPIKRNLAVYTDDYLYTMRRFLKGDEGMLAKVLSEMRQIPFKTGRIHYMNNYYGFTMMDMVSYDRKHNEANGEDNRDGNDFNYSWNCGEEGPSRRKRVQTLRLKQIKNAMTMLAFTQSTPLIFMGDEFGNSQKGNNNPYCQDNAVTWLDWNDLNKNAEIYAFWKEMMALRKSHPILRPEDELKIMDYISCGYPDLSYHGESAWRARMDSYNRQIGIMYCGKYTRLSRGVEDAFLYLAMNMYWESGRLAMPKLPKGLKWELKYCTDKEAGLVTKATGDKAVSGEDGKTDDAKVTTEIQIPARSCAVYISVPDEEYAKNNTKSHKSRKKAAAGAEDYSDRTMF
ncbi:MAG: hypothetical protein E7292_01740 [Lachnospiraceae bacterium]|nr:hypothetical protein [Lachnospiraceae bacterium]